MLQFQSFKYLRSDQLSNNFIVRDEVDDRINIFLLYMYRSSDVLLERDFKLVDYILHLTLSASHINDYNFVNSAHFSKCSDFESIIARKMKSISFERS